MIIMFLITTLCKKCNIMQEIYGTAAPILINWNVFYSNSKLCSAILSVESSRNYMVLEPLLYSDRSPPWDRGWAKTECWEKSRCSEVWDKEVDVNSDAHWSHISFNVQLLLNFKYLQIFCATLKYFQACIIEVELGKTELGEGCNTYGVFLNGK